MAAQPTAADAASRVTTSATRGVLISVLLRAELFLDDLPEDSERLGADQARRIDEECRCAVHANLHAARVIDGHFIFVAARIEPLVERCCLETDLSRPSLQVLGLEPDDFASTLVLLAKNLVVVFPIPAL